MENTHERVRVFTRIRPATPRPKKGDRVRLANGEEAIFIRYLAKKSCALFRHKRDGLVVFDFSTAQRLNPLTLLPYPPK